MKCRSLLLLVGVLFISGSIFAQDDSFDYGSIKDSVYSNEYFGITAPFPKSWNVQNQEQMKKLAEQGAEIIAGDDQNLKAMIKASEVHTAYLLTIFKYEAGAPVDFNPSFILVAENISAYPGIKEGKDYLFHTKKILEKASIAYIFDKDFAKKDISGKEFYEMNSSVVYNKLKVIQKYYSCIMKGFAVSIIISYAFEDGEKEVHDILAKVKFDTKE